MTRSTLKSKGLTERQIDVYYAICEGLSDEEIGTRLFISICCVRSHLGRIYYKLGVNSRYKLMILQLNV